jgi:hypothetical protein
MPLITGLRPLPPVANRAAGKIVREPRKAEAARQNAAWHRRRLSPARPVTEVHPPRRSRSSAALIDPERKPTVHHSIRDNVDLD